MWNMQYSKRPGAVLRIVVTRVILCALLVGVRLSAQEETRSDQIEAARDKKAQKLATPEDPHLEKLVERAEASIAYHLLTAEEGFGVGFGQLVSGAGFSTGPRYRKTLWDGRVRLGASLYGSLKQYYKGQFTASVSGFLKGHALINFAASHSDFPQMPYYGPGPDSRKTGRSNYRIENTSVEVRPTLKLAKGLTAGAIGSFMAINVGPGIADSYISTDRQFGPAVTPGIDRQTDYLKGGGFVEYDRRDKAGDPTRGGRYHAEYARLSDRDVGAYSFYQLNLDAQQYIPLFNGKRVIALHGATWLTDTNKSQTVPFYMQPALGGGDTMRGFRPFRFYDNNAVLIQGEYRWEASSVLDMALFADGGKVFHNWDQWNLHDLEGSFGFGIRFKTLSAVVLRIDTGFSREGFQIWFRVSNPF
jgi:outer membrane protein assembly factor BamA